jgi:hypothetical protein
MQLAASRMGDFQKGWELAQQLERETPEDDRAAYNRGWYLLRQGKLREGFALLDRGRREGVFGNSPLSSCQPQWDGKSKGTVLLYLEGGLGDQIHQARFAKDIAARGCKVVMACSTDLLLLLRQVDGADAIVTHEGMLSVYHDYWTPGMSAISALGYEYSDISGVAYMPRPFVEAGHKRRIGLRWSGNPMFEHEQHRKFPPQMLFDAVNGADAEFISLQRDLDTDARPAWVREVPLDTWLETQQAVASCDLVITSCTSVSHLSAAMGVPTWIVQPVMPYYLYAQPGDYTLFYDSVRLYRQVAFDNWSAPFVNIQHDLKEGVTHAAVG